MCSLFLLLLLPYIILVVYNIPTISKRSSEIVYTLAYGSPGRKILLGALRMSLSSKIT